MLAAINLTGTLLIVAALVLLPLCIGAIALRNRTRGKGVEIPPGMVPGPSDAALETPLLQKLQGWGVVLVAFFVVWFPLSWLREPSENLTQEKDLLTTSIARGAASVQLFSEENQLGVGCVRCHGPELRGSTIQSGNDFVVTPDLTTECGGPNTGHPNIFSQDDMAQVIREGRGVMPSWSIRFQGALDDQQITDIVNYLVEISKDTVPFEKNVCLNPDASAAALEANDPENGGAGLNPRDP